MLPKVGSTGVPLTTVTVEFTKLRLLRINDRNLVNELNRGSFLYQSLRLGQGAHRRRDGREDLGRRHAHRGRAQPPGHDLSAGRRDDPGDQAGCTC